MEKRKHEASQSQDQRGNARHTTIVASYVCVTNSQQLESTASDADTTVACRKRCVPVSTPRRHLCSYLSTEVVALSWPIPRHLLQNRPTHWRGTCLRIEHVLIAHCTYVCAYIECIVVAVEQLFFLYVLRFYTRDVRLRWFCFRVYSRQPNCRRPLSTVCRWSSLHSILVHYCYSATADIVAPVAAITAEARIYMVATMTNPLTTITRLCDCVAALITGKAIGKSNGLFCANLALSWGRYFFLTCSCQRESKEREPKGQVRCAEGFKRSDHRWELDVLLTTTTMNRFSTSLTSRTQHDQGRRACWKKHWYILLVPYKRSEGNFLSVFELCIYASFNAP